MPRLKLNGVWRGRYWYNPIEGAALPTGPTRFTMTLKTSWLFPGFWGEVCDESELENKERGRITGQRSGDTIRFVKQMPNAKVLHEGELLTFKAYFSRFEGLDLDENPPQPPLLYVGEHFLESDSFEGTWRFLPVPTRIRSNGRLLEIPPGPENGRWAAERVG
jgi:hypothetical protein